MNFGKALKKAMVDADLSNKELAEILGCTPGYITQLRNSTECPAGRLVPIAAAVKMKPSELIALGE